MNLFLSAQEIKELTGFALKSKQIVQLRKMGIPFQINGCGRPVITVMAINGNPQPAEVKHTWQPAVISRK